MKNIEKNAILVSTVKNVKMQDAGEKHAYPQLTTCESSKDDSISYPTLWLNTKQVPALKDFEVENEVILVVKGKITSHSLNESDKHSKESYDISIKEIGILDENISE